MRIITKNEYDHISGGISLGTAVFALTIGLVTGGPAGLGIAAAGIVGARGIDNLHDMVKNK